MTKRLRVVVVDDSPLCRVLLREILEADGDIEVVGEAGDGESAIRTIAQAEPDLATIDIMMPGPDGLWTVEQIMAKRPLPILVVTGQPAGSGSDLVFQAVNRGALDLAGKPSVMDEGASAALRAKVRRLARLPVVRHVRGHRAEEAPPKAPPFTNEAAAPRQKMQTWTNESSLAAPRQKMQSWTNESSLAAPRPAMGSWTNESSPAGACPVVGIAASAGGPAAIAAILSKLPRELPAAIALVQHLPVGFTEPFARFLRGVTPLKVSVVGGVQAIAPGVVFVPADDCHLVAVGRGKFEAQKTAPIGGHRPSATVLFRSLAQVFGAEALGIVLTGIGDDGARGLGELRERGGLTIAQDAASSAVYGMPQAAVREGAAQKSLRLDAIADLVLRTFLPLGEAKGLPGARQRGSPDRGGTS